jgi:hypothetical protein
MPAITIRYRKILSLALANNAINFTESSLVGHRVQISIPVDYLNTFFVWERASGSPRPVGHFLSEVDSLKFVNILKSALNKSYNDIDGSVGGLNFSSFILDSNYDSRLRCDGISANDIVMAYILYKCYGTSAAPTMNIIYNLEDAQKMITSEQVAAVIVESLEEDEELAVGPGVDKGGVDAMFRNILAVNPLRYFKADGTQIDGLFETNFQCSESDPPGRGPWGFIENDIIEMRLNFTFPKDVTHTTADDIGGKRTVVIPAGSTFAIRLQLLATDTAVGATSKQASAAAALAAANIQKQAAAATSAANASVNAAMAEQQRQAAAYRTDLEEVAYINAVNNNAAQAIRASNAQAQADAALAALEEAIVSGSTVSNIQNLRAAATAAAAAAARAAILSTQAATLLQNAENRKSAAEQELADAQTAASDAAYISATANSISVAAALAKAQADAATIAATTEEALEATDPEIKILTDSENKLLDPNTLSSARLSLSSMNSKTKTAWNDFISATRSQIISKRKLDSITLDINCAILSGKSVGEISILESSLASLIDANKSATHSVSVMTSALIKAQSNEKNALDYYVATASQAASLSLNIASSAVTHATGVLETATQTFNTATTQNTTAQNELIELQDDLSTAISDGALMSELTILRKAVITATSVAKTRASALLAAKAAKEAAQLELTQLTEAKNSADAKLITVKDNNDELIEQYEESIESLQAFEDSSLLSAETTSAANALNAAHIRFVSTSQDSILAIATYDTAKRAYDIANAANPQDISLIDKLNRNLLDALVKKNATAAALLKAKDDYENSYSGVIENVNSKEILEEALEAFTLSVTNSKKNTLALALYTAIENSNAAKIDMDNLEVKYTLDKNALDSAITSGATLEEIRNINLKTNNSRTAYVNATIKYNAAQAAVTTANVNVTLSGESAAILTNVAVLQYGQIMLEKANALVADITLKYQDVAAINQQLLSAKGAYTVASSALVNSVKAGRSIDDIIPLQKALQKASIELSRMTFLSAGKTLALTNAMALATQDSIAKGIIDATSISIGAASVISKINTLKAASQKLSNEMSAASSILIIADEKLLSVKLALDTAITSGQSISDIQNFQTAVLNATNERVIAESNFTKITAAYTQSVADMNALTQQETEILASAEKTPLTAAIAELAASNAQIILFNKRRSADILAASVLSHTSVMKNAQKDLLKATSELQKAQAAYTDAKEELDASIEAGVTLDSMKDILSAEQSAAAQVSLALANKNAANTAYLNAQASVADLQDVADALEAIAVAAGV